ncbi:MAG: hypothetical protein AMXMBFR45_18050 [Gammaproteobacteria bacterium]|nr:MAG: hypothetical protein BroJett010_00200 [Gammaproteobacteria bacterium]
MTRVTQKRQPAPAEPHVHGPDCDHDHDHHHEPAEPYRRDTPKLGRNDPCFCGSGKKYKKCHGAAS